VCEQIYLLSEQIGFNAGVNQMRRKLQLLTGACAVLLLTALTASAQAVKSGATSDETTTRLVDAKVVEVAENHISVIASTGVEHVIEINSKSTKVTRDGEEVSLKNLREGDIVTVELDEQNPVKFAKNISMSVSTEQVARLRP
jgi:multidrug resistance efflux pump